MHKTIRMAAALGAALSLAAVMAAPAGAGPTQTPTLPAPPPGVIAPGARVVIVTSGAGANIRQQPTTSAAVVTSQDDGTVLTITGNSQQADGLTWWPVQGDGYSGWIAEALISPAP